MFPRSLKNKVLVLVVSFLVLGPSLIFSSTQPEALKRSPSYKAIAVKILETIRLPKYYHEGLFCDGNAIWVSNGENGKIWVVDRASGKAISDIVPIAHFTEAVSRISDNRFFVTDWDEEKIYNASLDKKRFNPETWVSVKPAHPAGVMWNNNRLYVITWTRGMGTRFDLLELDGGMKLLKTIAIKNIQEPAHLAWDGKNLWITSWYDPLVYKVDVNKWEILGAFRSPVSKTTGIAWDGKYLWLTGTYSDLYKVEVMG